ncbi:MAG: hypothetical protein KAS39_05220 [Actinomycetia bacterium]|nr:hypothetical protein [Actinomycetes bacterium]
MTEMIITLILLAIVSFIQNMFFTLSARSRNSGDPGYHRFCAWGSNGVWFMCQVMIVKHVWAAINAGNWGLVILAGLVYTIFTAEGSVLMMKKLLKFEKGKRKVGATGGDADPEKLLARIAKLESCMDRLAGTAAMGSPMYETKFRAAAKNSMDETTFRREYLGEDGVKEPEADRKAIDKYNAEVDEHNRKAEDHNAKLDDQDEGTFEPDDKDESKEG